MQTVANSGRVARAARSVIVAAALACFVGCGDGGDGGTKPAMVGAIESFYGPPYSFEQRLDLVRFLAVAGLDTYLYAPKSDRYHRDGWREPYPSEFMAHFAELVREGDSGGVRFVFALSPGEGFDPDAGDFAAVTAKLGALFDVGVRDFCLLFDDLDARSRAADPDLQVQIVVETLAFLRGLDPDSGLCFISHYYAGSADEIRTDRAIFNSSFTIKSSAAYAAYDFIPRDVPILWTGRRVFAAHLTVADVRDLQTFVDRPLLVWDNYPVNDVVLSRELFMAPYREREAGIAAAAGGVLLNTALQPEVSKIALWTAGRFFADGEAYDPDTAFAEALEIVAGSASGARVLARLADQFRSHPLIGNEPESPALAARAAAFFQARSAASEQALRELFDSFTSVADDLAREVDNAPLIAELEGPSRKLSLLGTAGLLALDLLAAQARGEPVDASALRAQLTAAGAIPWLVGANTRIGPPLDEFFAGREAVRADVFGDFFTAVLAELEAR